MGHFIILFLGGALGFLCGFAVSLPPLKKIVRILRPHPIRTIRFQMERSWKSLAGFVPNFATSIARWLGPIVLYGKWKCKSMSPEEKLAPGKQF